MGQAAVVEVVEVKIPELGLVVDSLCSEVLDTGLAFQLFALASLDPIFAN